MVIIRAGAVVADAFTTLCQWKWFGGMPGLFSRVICACLDPANRGRNFSGIVFGGVWFIGELAGRITWDEVPCFQALSEKSHADYFAVLGSLIAEMLAIYDLRKCGRLLEMKNRFCGDDGLITCLKLNLCASNHRTFTDLKHRFLAYGGGLTLAVRIFWGDGSVRVQCGNRSSAVVIIVLGYSNVFLGRRPRQGAVRRPKFRSLHMCGIRVLGGAARPTCGAAMA